MELEVREMAAFICLSWSFTVQSYLSGKLQTPSQRRAPKGGLGGGGGGGVALHWKQYSGYLHAKQLLMGVNLADPEYLVGRKGATDLLWPCQPWPSVQCRNPGNAGDPTAR